MVMVIVMLRAVAGVRARARARVVRVVVGPNALLEEEEAAAARCPAFVPSV